MEKLLNWNVKENREFFNEENLLEREVIDIKLFEIKNGVLKDSCVGEIVLSDEGFNGICVVNFFVWLYNIVVSENNIEVVLSLVKNVVIEKDLNLRNEIEDDKKFFFGFENLWEECVSF